jgi:hypothetical protein
MSVFVHLTSSRNIPPIRRSGIALPSGRPSFRGIFAVPVGRNFYLTHQWLRELRRWQPSSVVAVYFRPPDDELVRVGCYGTDHRQMTANKAAAFAMTLAHIAPTAPSKPSLRGHTIALSGFQVIFNRRIQPREILRIKPVPQTVGWRYFPGSNGTPPCTCPYCQRGIFGAAKLRRRRTATE